MRFSDIQIKQMVDFHSELLEKGLPKVGFTTYDQFKIVRLHKTLERLIPQYG